MSALIYAMVQRRRAADAQAAATKAEHDRVVAAAKGDPGQPGKPSMVWRGAWTADLIIRKGDVVGYKGSSFIAVVNNPKSAPNDGDEWNTVAAAGAPGKKGDKGNPGRVVIYGSDGGGGGSGGGEDADAVPDPVELFDQELINPAEPACADAVPSPVDIFDAELTPTT